MPITDLGRADRDLHAGSRGGDQGLQDALLAAELGIELALGDLGSGGDLERAGPGIALLHQHRKGRGHDGAPARRQAVEGGMLGGGELLCCLCHVYPLDWVLYGTVRSCLWYL